MLFVLTGGVTQVLRWWCGCHDHAVCELFLAEQPEERADIVKGQRSLFFVELGLDSGEATGDGVFGDKVDSGVGFAFVARPVFP